MSESILNHGYVAEEHAPDPVTSHGDPTMPGKVGLWLFLASEIMFFIGILGTYIIFRSGAPEMFSRHGETLSKWLAGLNTLVLIFSSLTMALAVHAAQVGQLVADDVIAHPLRRLHEPPVDSHRAAGRATAPAALGARQAQ